MDFLEFARTALAFLLPGSVFRHQSLAVARDPSTQPRILSTILSMIAAGAGFISADRSAHYEADPIAKQPAPSTVRNQYPAAMIQPMEKFIHWIVFISIVAGALGCLFQLVTTGSIQSPPFGDF